MSACFLQTLWPALCALLDAGRSAEAPDCCEKAVGADPDFGAGYINKGAALPGLGRLDEPYGCIHTGSVPDPDRSP